jgi:hypothetical protein
VQDLAAEKIGDGGQTDVRVRPYVESPWSRPTMRCRVDGKARCTKKSSPRSLLRGMTTFPISGEFTYDCSRGTLHFS